MFVLSLCKFSQARPSSCFYDKFSGILESKLLVDVTSLLVAFVCMLASGTQAVQIHYLVAPIPLVVGGTTRNAITTRNRYVIIGPGIICFLYVVTDTFLSSA
jgi:hypothetical protein